MTRDWLVWLVAVLTALVAMRALEAWEHTECLRAGGRVAEGCASDRCER